MTDMANLSQINRLQPKRRRRYQHGSLQKRKSGKHMTWVAFWREGDSRRGKTMGKCADLTRGEALTKMNALVQPLNTEAARHREHLWTVRELIEESYFELGRRKWKASTASTTIDRIRYHLVQELGDVPISSITRDRLQRYLEEKEANGVGHGTRLHLRWDLRAIFRLAFQDGLIPQSPAEVLFVSGELTVSRTVLTPKQVERMLEVLDLREELAVRLAIFSGMRPGEILALQWKHVQDDHVEVVQRIYRGKIDRPKTRRSARQVALSPGTQQTLQLWRELTSDPGPDAWLFPSETSTHPITRDNLWRRYMLPRLEKLGLNWATFQVMRRTHASLSRKAGIDPKLVADQLGHGLGVNLDVYTVAALEQRLVAVESLETSMGTSTERGARPS